MPRKVVKKGKGSKILGSLSPVYGMISGKGAFANLPSPAGLLAKKMRKNKQTPVAATANMKYGGSICKGMGKATRGGNFSRNG